MAGDDPKWISAVQLRLLHAEVIRQFGGRDGLRDPGGLESAADAPRNRFVYEPDAGIFDLAATLAGSLSRNHPFVDGNKRTALLAIRVFLSINGYRFEPDPISTVTNIDALAAGRISAEELAGWIGEYSVAKG